MDRPSRSDDQTAMMPNSLRTAPLSNASNPVHKDKDMNTLKCS
jgi:hypothetical protein